MRILITGANGHIGRRLIARLNEEQPEVEVVALVRSDRAADRIRQDQLKAEIQIVDYADPAALGRAGEGSNVVVHLVGIIKQSAMNTFEMAHEAPCRALVAAGLSAGHLVSLGIVGTGPDSQNACFRSRFDAEEILRAGSIPTTILRVPMVLGPDDYASAALARNAAKSIAISFRASSLEQPIYCEDVVAAILACIKLAPAHRTLELAGPESLSRRDLIKRAGRCVDNSPRVFSIPIGVGYVMAALMERLMANPPVTAAMLGVLDHDDAIDTSACTEMLALPLTGLDEVLEAVIAR